MESLQEYRELFMKGDNSLLKHLYVRFHDDVLNVLKSKRLCRPQDTEGYFHEALIQFYERIAEGKLEEVSSVKNYLIGICINLVKRENTHKLKIEKKIDNVRLHLYNNYDYTSTASTKGVMMKKVKAALSTLSEKCQTIIIAYYLDRLTMKEIACYLGLSSGDVAKTLKSRCFKSLMKRIKSETL